MLYIKKLSLAILVAGFMLGPAIPARAQSSSASAQELVAKLQQQIAALQVQLEALKKAQAEVIAGSQQVAETVKLLRNLREGMSGDDVKTLQAILAKYPDLYPEGLITGFYGRATARAVKKFQEREKVEAVGTVGPKTLSKLAKELERDPIGHEEDKGDRKNKHAKRPCAIMPPGHLIAPGWLRKHDGVQPVVPPCQKLPPGIERITEGSRGTTTPDTIAPIISAVSATGTVATLTHITWLTNEKANSKVWYSTTSPVSLLQGALTAGNESFVLSHDLTLSLLTASTTYHYFAVSKDTAGNSATSTQYSFTTAP